jgi:hypothetical protein
MVHILGGVRHHMKHPGRRLDRRDHVHHSSAPSMIPRGGQIGNAGSDRSGEEEISP